MAKKINRSLKTKQKIISEDACYGCGCCNICAWLFPVLIIIIALVPQWLNSAWGKWAIILLAILTIINYKWCPSCKK